jgi:formylglycine-generating enzyme
VGKKRANRYGLYDMLGNVFEWCWDAYDKDYYKQSPSEDPTGPDSRDSGRVRRGGNWLFGSEYARSDTRPPDAPMLRSIMGFRLALVQ